MESRTSVRRVAALVLALVLGCTAAARAQDEVTLRGAAEVDGSRPVLLADVADLRGPAAEALASVVLLDKWPAGDTSWTTLEFAAVKAAINASPRVNWGRLSLNGSSCVVRRGGEAAKAGPAADQAAAATRDEAVAGTSGTRVRDLIPARIAQLLGLEESSLRLEYEDSAAELLSTPVEGRQVEITPSGMADRVPLSVRVYEKDRIAASGSVRVGVTVKREVLVARTALKRGDAVMLKDAAIETRWIGPTTPAAGVEAFGSVVRAGKIAPGQLIQDSDLTPAVVVKKGEMVSVSCVAGSVVLKTLARATSDARKGDVIKFESAEKGKDKKDVKREFLARVAGPGRAVTATASAEAAGDLVKAE